MMIRLLSEDYLAHHGILGMKWGVRRYQNKDGSLTPAGEKRYRKILENDRGYHTKTGITKRGVKAYRFIDSAGKFKEVEEHYLNDDKKLFGEKDKEALLALYKNDVQAAEKYSEAVQKYVDSLTLKDKESIARDLFPGIAKYRRNELGEFPHDYKPFANAEEYKDEATWLVFNTVRRKSLENANVKNSAKEDYDARQKTYRVWADLAEKLKHDIEKADPQSFERFSTSGMRACAVLLDEQSKNDNYTTWRTIRPDGTEMPLTVATIYGDFANDFVSNYTMDDYNKWAAKQRGLRKND